MKSLRAIALVGLLLLGGCAKRGPGLAELEPDILYGRAAAAYQAEEYGRAIRLLDVFVQQHLADPRAPEARLMLGRAHMAREDYITAVAHLQRLLQDYPATPLGLEARIGICDSYALLSPSPALDQEYTRAAILHCQSVAENFPGTPEATRAAERVTDLRTKLARKVYETGMFYLKRRAYDAAVVYFQEVVDLYPRTEVAPAALQQLVQTYTLIGYVEEAEAARARLLRDYPTSPEAQAVRA